MKEYLRQIVAAPATNLLKRSVAREYLQARILQSLQESGAFLTWAFLGGTALRFLYSIPRYSEDLDFSLSGSGGEVGLSSAMMAAKNMFEAEGYTLEVKAREAKAVHSAFVRFRGLFHDLGLSPRASETLSIKVEIDAHPPAGARLETTLIRRHVTLHLPHYDKASMLGGKLHALLARRYVKGRDLYDLVWFLSDPSWPAPNLDLLNAALAQTKWTGVTITRGNWRDVLWGRLEGIAWKQAVEDVQPFLERESDLAWLTEENVQNLLRKRNAR